MRDGREPICVMEGYRFGVVMDQRRVCALVDRMVFDGFGVMVPVGCGDCMFTMLCGSDRYILANAECGFVFTFENKYVGEENG